jgi:beta-N-acetylhexosaminidase
VAIAHAVPRSNPRSRKPNAGRTPKAGRPAAVPRQAAASPGTHRSSRAPRSSASLASLVGQLIVGRYVGSTPSAQFVARVRRGEIGGVILFGDNTAGGPTQTRAVISELQDAARAGHNPRLLVMTDQEGGEVKRIAGPPTEAPALMSSDAVAWSQGQATGDLLRSLGINVDLAPVADVERAPNSFLGTRSFGSSPALVGARACAFARGLASTGVAYTLKHFPGLGRAEASTDVAPVVIPVAGDLLRADYDAYLECGADRRALIMVSSAIYPSLLGPLPAVMSPATYRTELPAALGGPGGITISDDLQAGALTSQPAPALHAIDAGLDLALYATDEQGSANAFERLLTDAQNGRLPLSRLREAAAAVVAFKKELSQ